MNRRDVGRLCCAALVACCSVAIGRADVIESSTVTLNATDAPISFEFGSGAEALAGNAVIVGLEVNWKITPGTSGVEAQINAGLAIPSFEVGDRLDSALATTLPGTGDAPVEVESTMFASEGLAIGPAVIDELLKDADNAISAVLFTSGVDAENLADFFDDGGIIEAQLVLQTAGGPVNEPPPTQGGTVPEPMSLAIWGAAGALALYSRRRQAA